MFQIKSGSQSPQPRSTEEMSEWLSHRELTHNRRNYVLMENRIRLLKMENEKKQKRIEDSQRKAEQLQMIRYEQEQDMKEKDRIKRQRDFEQAQLRLKIESMRHSAERDKANKLQQLHQERLMNYYDARLMRNQNDKTITNYKEIEKLRKREQSAQIKNKETQSLQKVKTIKFKQIQQFNKDHQEQKMKNLAEVATHKQRIFQLEEMENSLIQQLQQNQHAHKLVQQTLSKIQKTKASWLKLDRSCDFINDDIL